MTNLTPSTRLFALLADHPFLEAFLKAYNPRYKVLESRAMRASVGRVASLRMVAAPWTACPWISSAAMTPCWMATMLERTGS